MCAGIHFLFLSWSTSFITPMTQTSWENDVLMPQCKFYPMPFGLLSSFQEDICFIVMKYILKIILSCHRWPIAGTEQRSNYPQGILDLIIRPSLLYSLIGWKELCRCNWLKQNETERDYGVFWYCVTFHDEAWTDDCSPQIEEWWHTKETIIFKPPLVNRRVMYRSTDDVVLAGA